MKWVDLVCVLVGILVNLSSVSTQCPDDCCYWYSTVPGNLTCNPQRQHSVILRSAIYTPNTTVVGVRVKWYRSELARNGGVLVNTIDALNPRSPISSGRFRGLTRISSNNNIRNFTASDNGYYWCQIEVNGTCLQPSPSGLITFNSTSRLNCSSFNTVGINLGESPICAARTFSSSISIVSTSSTTGTTIPTTNTPNMATDDMNPSGCFSFNSSDLSGEVCTYGVITGSSVVVVTCFLLVVILSLCICVRKRKRRAMEVGTAKPANSDYDMQKRVQKMDITMTDESFSADRLTATVEQPPQESHMYDVIEDNTPALASGKNKWRRERKEEVVVQQKSDDQRLSAHTSTINKCYASLNPDSVAYESMYSQSSPISGERIREEEVRGEDMESARRKADLYSSIDKWTLDKPGDYAHIGEKNS